MILAALLSYVAGLLTAFAPCVLPLLPIILGGSLIPEDRDRKRPYIIVASLVVSLILFTILLKVSTVLIGVDPKVWVYFSGILVISLGLLMLFPGVWAKAIAGLGIEHRSQSLLGKAFQNKNKTVSAILIGTALGPVFSSCSPTYAWVLATVLPSNTYLGLFYLVIYCLGVATSLLAIALLGRKLLERVKWASDPKGWFQRAIAILFIIVGIFIITGWDKKVQTYLVDKDFLNLVQLEQKLVPGEENNAIQQSQSTNSDKKSYNVNPYPAPEIQDITAWINSDPQTIAGLKGKVVLIDFWTYSCINCLRTQPYLNAWHDKYKDSGLVILGLHAPEFAFEKVPDNVSNAVKDAKIKYPVALDNNFATWRAYNNKYWPAKYLIDKDGEVRYTHFGEGDYDETESTIQELLREAGNNVSRPIEKQGESAGTESGQTPETYLSYTRGERFANATEFKADQPIDYNLVDRLSKNEWTLGGKWQINDESSQSLSKGSELAFNYSAREVYIVMSGPPGAMVTVAVEGLARPGGVDVDAQNQVKIDGARLYKIVKTDSFVNQKLILTFPAGVTVNAFTFGS
ncbi:MAG TPA: cytochrome c biogenesis protein DipZ [Candidatus Limnocylindrales bacterium]|nr:cytochrome c biogenesis protein DipZ [Candidatus Limnocylindrales bacterium]